MVTSDRNAEWNEAFEAGVEAERERCALIAEAIGDKPREKDSSAKEDDGMRVAARIIARAIRSQ